VTSVRPGADVVLAAASVRPRPSPQAGRGAAPTRTLLRGLDVIDALSAADALGLGTSAIADSTGLDKATVSRLLRTLVEAGWVRQDEVTRRYRLTAKIVRLAGSVRAHLDLRTAAAPHLRALRQRLGETVHLGVMEDARVFYLDKLEAPNSIQLVSRVGQLMPLHTTSLGKAILAALPEEECEAILAGIDFAPRTEMTIDNIEDFREALALTRERGFATDDRENEPLGACVAAAIMGADGRPLGAISASGPHYRIRDHFADFGRQVRATAAAVALDLGASPDHVPGRSAGTESAP
jgi:DNA-binding IclR family transcriptional regulator